MITVGERGGSDGSERRQVISVCPSPADVNFNPLIRPLVVIRYFF